jgi:copper homeostasis protein
MMKKHPLLEVCVDSPAGLEAAVNGGARRIELCSALALSGLTPSPGLMALAAQTPVPVYAMIRPRPGDFCYGALELDAMRRDIDAVRAAGLAGVVLGASNASGALGEAALRLLIRHAADLGTTLHRAFDLAPDLAQALETAVGLGFERVLTSGGRNTAIEGASCIADLVARAKGRIGVMAGAGLSWSNVADLVRVTGVDQVHASCGAPASQGGAEGWRRKAAELGFLDGALRDTDQGAVIRMVETLDALAAEA